jgi:hypothetical protein
MEVNELRVGNLVRANCIYEGQVKTFKRLNETLDVLFFSDGNKWETGEFLSDCDPVELTEEWLFWFGFKKVGINFEKDSILLWYSNYQKSYVFRFCNFGGNLERPININFIHQLQNLYFTLTSEELQLNKSV